MFDLHNQLDVIEKDVVYQRIDGVDWQCRIHMPAQPGKHPWPMLLDVHGGGWNRFDRTRDGPVDQQLAALGMVVAWACTRAARPLGSCLRSRFTRNVLQVALPMS